MRWAVDGDIILYSVAFAASKDPISYACTSSRSMVQRLMDRLGAEGCDIYLTGDDNYRIEYGCSLYPYKGNRADEKPAHYADLKNYMIDSLGAVVIDGQEADDQMGIDAVQYGSGIATIDKDLYGVPGWHYNWKNEVLVNVSPEDADRFFYCQLLTGDPVDNIPGLYKRTRTRATAKVLEPLQDMYYPEEMYTYVRNVYLKGAAKTGHTEADVDDWLMRQARQLWIRRQERELWNPPK